MGNRKDVAKQNKQNKQVEQANNQAENKNAESQNNNAGVENTAAKENTQAPAPIENKDNATTETPAENVPAVNDAPTVITESKNTHVIVCLKHPHGIKFKLDNNRSVVINGNAAHLKGKTTGVLPDGGFGMTTISKEDWEAIKNTYSTMSIFKSGLIFASADTVSAQAQAKEYDELKSGFEPVDIKKEKNIGVKDFEK